MNDDHIPRIDKYLWAIRVYKTRSDAADACRGGKVSVNGLQAKPSREVKIDDTIAVRKGPVSHSYKVLSITNNRLSAKNLTPYITDITPPEEMAKGQLHNQTATVWRERGSGRPTKKERRDIDKLMDYNM
ncbi:MAG: RNA-binding S4 domain-containing protein [Prevotellaceae bacterium]|jgi:ribosome-associated heat shock protein Hsp15|nr:RNA-binding S4 domain-containing protein [Prevotellaceae bacterium]